MLNALNQHAKSSSGDGPVSKELFDLMEDPAEAEAEYERYVMRYNAAARENDLRQPSRG
jgi:hypothetical protein